MIRHEPMASSRVRIVHSRPFAHHSNITPSPGYGDRSMKITISVPTPCHENWDAMSPREQGRHCAQCDHVVADLTTATDAQLVALFTSDSKPKCARFDPRQLDRALGAAEKQQQSRLPAAAFTSLLAVAAGHEALAQQGAPIMLGEPAIAQPMPPPPQVTGKMMFVPHSIPPVCNIPITGDTVAVITPQPDPPLEHTEIGDVEIQVDGLVKGDIKFIADPMEVDSAVATRIEPMMDTTPSMEIDPKDPLGITGVVVDPVSGMSISNAIVAVRGTDVRIRCNEHGRFGFRIPEDLAGVALIIDISVQGEGSMSISLSGQAVPCAVPVKFKPDEPQPAPTEATTPHDLGTIVILRESEPVQHLTGICVTTYVAPPTTWQRIVAPVKRGWNNLRH